MLAGIPLQVTLTCPNCHQPLHVQGLGSAEVCGACMAEHPLPETTWLGMFGAEEIAEAMACAEGDGHQVTSMGGGGATYAYGRRMPRCQSCKTDVPPDVFESAAAVGHHDCSCGKRIRVRPANEVARLIVPGARFLVGEGATGASGATAESGSEPVMFACMACAGSLTVDGSSRTITCGYCGGSNYLPDGLWLRLHPPRTVVTFFVVAELDGDVEGPGPELLARLAVSEDYEVRAAAAKNANLDPSFFEALAADDDSDVRRALARNPALPDSIIQRLSEDDDYQVRAAVVRRLSLERLAERIAQETDSDVLKAVGKRKDLDDTVLQSLARSRYYGARVVAAKHRNSSDAVLLLLVDESDSDVERALQRRELSPTVLEAFAASDSYEIRRLVAAKENTPDAVLIKLAADDDHDVLRTLLERQRALPAAAVRTLAGHYTFGEQARARPEYAAAVWARRKRSAIIALVLVAVLLCVGVVTGGIGLLVVLIGPLIGM